MNIDGRHHLACLCAIPKDNQEKSTVSPLMFMFVLKDLVVDMSHFYAQYKSVKPWLQLKESTEHTYAERSDGLKVFNETYQSPEDRKKLDGMYECILCACCSTSCPSASLLRGWFSRVLRLPLLVGSLRLCVPQVTGGTRTSTLVRQC